MKNQKKQIKQNNRRRRIWPKLLIALLLLVLIVPFGVSATLYNLYFNKRADDFTEKDLSAEDFPELSYTEVTFPSGKNELTGYLYYPELTEEEIEAGETYKGLVVCCHGIWCRHENLLYEIEYFVNNGYMVFAYDNTGTSTSEGDSIIGLVQSQLDLDAALTFIEGETQLATLPKVLYGHSWGAYAVTSVLNYEHDVKAVVAMAPFNQSIDMLLETGSSMYGSWVSILKPYLSFYERLKFGSCAGYTALDGINNTDIPILIYHSNDDETISLDSSVYALADSFTNENAAAILVPNRGHHPFLSDAAIAYRKAYDAAEEAGEDVSDEFDKTLYYELDEDIMQQVIDLYDAAVAEE